MLLVRYFATKCIFIHFFRNYPWQLTTKYLTNGIIQLAAGKELLDDSGTQENSCNNSGKISVPESSIQTILVRTRIAQHWYILELPHRITNSDTFQNCTYSVNTRIEVVKHKTK